MMGQILSEAVSKEVAARVRLGSVQVSLSAYQRGLREIGYRLNRDLDCMGNARYMTGERAGESYPSLAVTPVQLDNGLAFCHVDARRDGSYEKLKEFRNTVFAVSRNRIVEF